MSGRALLLLAAFASALMSALPGLAAARDMPAPGADAVLALLALGVGGPPSQRTRNETMLRRAGRSLLPARSNARA
jgi:hypothetical protein